MRQYGCIFCLFYTNLYVIQAITQMLILSFTVTITFFSLVFSQTVTNLQEWGRFLHQEKHFHYSFQVHVPAITARVTLNNPIHVQSFHGFLDIICISSVVSTLVRDLMVYQAITVDMHKQP